MRKIKNLSMYNVSGDIHVDIHIENNSILLSLLLNQYIII